MTRYRFIGSHSHDFNADGKVLMVAPGDYVELTDDDIKSNGYEEMVDNGMLLDASSLPQEKKAPGGGK